MGWKLISVFVLSLFLLVSVLPQISQVKAQSIEWNNPFSYQVNYNNGTTKLVVFMGPKVFWNNETNQWTSLLLINNTDHVNPHYILRNSHITAKIGINTNWDVEGVLYYNPDFTKRICAEFWNVQGFIGGSWQTMDKSFFTHSVFQNSSLLNVTGVFRTFYQGVHVGWFRISYILRSGSFLKHEVAYRSIVSPERDYRVVMSLVGIAGTKIIHRLGETTVTLTEQEIQSHYLRFVNSTNSNRVFLSEKLESLGHWENDSWINDYLKAIRVRLVDYWGKQLVRADIVIGNYTLNQNDELFIDPDTSTFDIEVGTDDTFVEDDDNNHPGDWTGIDTTRNTFLIGYLGATTDYYGAGFMFRNVTVPQGATINSAYLNVTANAAGSGNTVNALLECQDSDDSLTFSTVGDYNGRARTTASISWAPIGAWTAGVEYQSPDIATAVKEVVDIATWSSGNNMTVFFEDAGTSTNLRKGNTVEHTPADETNEPELTITYTVAAGQELSFNLFENFNIWSSITKTMELSNLLFENVNVLSSLTMNKEKGLSLFENILVYSSLSRGIEISRSLSEIVKVWSSLVTATEGVAQELAFILFESVKPFVSLATTITEAVSYATQGFVLAAIWLTFFILIIGLCVYLGVKRH